MPLTPLQRQVLGVIGASIEVARTRTRTYDGALKGAPAIDLDGRRPMIDADK